jgi:hypothetical protein
MQRERTNFTVHRGPTRTVQAYVEGLTGTHKFDVIDEEDLRKQIQTQWKIPTNHYRFFPSFRAGLDGMSYKIAPRANGGMNDPRPPGTTRWKEMSAKLERDQPCSAAQTTGTMMNATPAGSPNPDLKDKAKWKTKFPKELDAMLEWTGPDLLKAQVSGVWPITRDGSWFLTNTKVMAERWGISQSNTNRRLNGFGYACWPYGSPPKALPNPRLWKTRY